MWTLRILYPHDIRWYLMIPDDIVLCEPQRLNARTTPYVAGDCPNYSSLLIVFDGLARWDHWCIILDTVSSSNDSFFRRDHRSIIAHCHLTKAYQEYPRILEMLPGKLCRKPNIWWIMGSSPANDQTWRRGSKCGDRSLLSSSQTPA